MHAIALITDDDIQQLTSLLAEKSNILSLHLTKYVLSAAERAEKGSRTLEFFLFDARIQYKLTWDNSKLFLRAVELFVDYFVIFASVAFDTKLTMLLDKIHYRYWNLSSIKTITHHLLTQSSLAVGKVC